MSHFYAYVHARPDNRIFYVGKGCGKRAFSFYKRNRYHQNIVRKYGSQNIAVGILECSSEEIAFQLEKGLVKCLRRNGVKLVNRTDGGEGAAGYKHTEEQIANNSRAQKIAQNRPEVIAKRVAATKGRKQTPESNAKRSATLKIKRNTKEYHDRHSAAIKGRPQTPEHVRKRIDPIKTPVTCVETGQLFSSATEAAKWCIEQKLTTAIYANCGVSRAAAGIQKTAFGFHWKY